MALKVPDPSERALLDALTGSTLLTGCHVRLYKNNYTPVDATVVGDLTAADFQGYSQANLASPAAATTVSNKAVTSWDQVTYTKGAGGTGNSIYGYYVVDSAGNLLWAERDPAAPVDMSVDGNQYKVTPKLTLNSES